MELYKTVYFQAKASRFLTRSFRDIWFVYQTNQLSLQIKRSITRQIINFRNVQIILSFFLILLNILRISINLTENYRILVIPSFIAFILSIIGAIGQIQLNLILQSIHIFGSLVIEIIFLIFAYLSYEKTHNKFETLFIFLPQVMDLLILLPVTVIYCKVLIWYDRSTIPNSFQNHQLEFENIDRRQNQVELGVKKLDNSKYDNKMQSESKQELPIIKDPQESEIENSNQKQKLYQFLEICVVCLLNEKNTMFYKCGHVCCCQHCATQVMSRDKCPICRAKIKDIVKIYQS